MTYKPSFVAAATALTVAFGMGWVSAASAQVKDLHQQEAEQYDSDTLRSFAVATVEVERINQTYLPELQAAESPEDLQEIQETAQDEMIDAVEAEGLSVELYNQIHQDARINPALANQIGQYMDAVAPPQTQ